MRFLLLTAMAGMAAVVLATGTASVSEETPVPAVPPAESTASGVIQTGRTLGPLSPDEMKYEPVTVPEPVWASIMAACALSLMRRGRR